MKQKLSLIIPLLTDWYRANARAFPWRTEPTPYHVWLSEIMLQQTRIEAVIPYYTRFTEALPDIASLAACDDERLMKLWQGLGYYSRARNLKRAAGIVCEEYGGELPDDYASLRSLPGIGDYTAGAIAGIAFGLPEPAVDGNVLRVLTRVTACRDDIAKNSTKQTFAAALREVYPSGSDAGLLTNALMELGQTVCPPNGAPHCEACPISAHCEARRLGITGELPVKAPKAARKIEVRTVLLLERDGCFAIRKRPASGLLAGLWEFPSLPGEADADGLAAFLSDAGLTHAGEVETLPDAVHIFTHREWHMRGLRLPVTGEPSGLVFAAPDELRERYAVPSAFSAYLSLILQ